MTDNKIYWDSFLQTRVVIHASAPDQLAVEILDEPGVQLEQWGDIRPVPGTTIWTSWENLKPLVVH